MADTKTGGTGSFGIEWAKFAMLDDAGVLKSPANGGVGTDGVYLVDGGAEGTQTANITGIEEKGTIQYANNKAKRVQHGAQAPSVALTMLDMNYLYLNLLKGYVSDSKGGYVLSSKGKPHVALIICSQDFDGSKIYDCFANGELIEVGKNHGTNTNAEIDYNPTLEYDALDPLADDTFVDDNGAQALTKTYFAADTGFDEAAMYKEVFGGYTAATSSTPAGQ